MLLRTAGLTLVSLIALSTPALALEPGQCGNAAEIQAILKAEGQVPIVMGDHIITQRGQTVTVRIFTANSNGMGYALRGDARQGQKSNQVCVDARYHDVRVNDIASPALPSWALIGNDNKKAEADCKARKANLCVGHDDYMRRWHAAGRRIMMMARTDFANPDGTRRNGRWLTILTIPEEHAAEVTATNSVGASEETAILDKANFTQFAGNFVRAGN